MVVAWFPHRARRLPDLILSNEATTVNLVRDASVDKKDFVIDELATAARRHGARDSFWRAQGEKIAERRRRPRLDPVESDRRAGAGVPDQCRRWRNQAGDRKENDRRSRMSHRAVASWQDLARNSHALCWIRVESLGAWLAAGRHPNGGAPARGRKLLDRPLMHAVAFQLPTR